MKMSTRKQRSKAKASTQPSRKPKVLVLGHADEPITDAGGQAVTCYTGDTRAMDLVKHADAVLLTGGGDVDPSLYGQDRHPQNYGISEQRDLVELEVLKIAGARGIPVLGICRGAQIMNVAAGGTLYQNITDDPEVHQFHQGHDHRVRTAKGSRVGMALGGVDEADNLWVISIHHQAVATTAPGFVATAWGLDGTVEAIEAIDRWWVGVQFHPEMAAAPGNRMQQIFNRFVAEAARVAGLAAPKVKVPQTFTRRPELPAYQPAQVSTNRPRRPRLTGEPVLTRWRCFRCQIDFDLREDHLDHMDILHGVKLPGAARLVKKG